MATRRNKSSGVKACRCDKCELEHPSTVQGKRHRRCGGKPGAAPLPKHTRGDVRGVWR